MRHDQLVDSRTHPANATFESDVVLKAVDQVRTPRRLGCRCPPPRVSRRYPRSEPPSILVSHAPSIWRAGFVATPEAEVQGKFERGNSLVLIVVAALPSGHRRTFTDLSQLVASTIPIDRSKRSVRHSRRRGPIKFARERPRLGDTSARRIADHSICIGEALGSARLCRMASTRMRRSPRPRPRSTVRSTSSTPPRRLRAAERRIGAAIEPAGGPAGEFVLATTKSMQNRSTRRVQRRHIAECCAED